MICRWHCRKVLIRWYVRLTSILGTAIKPSRLREVLLLLCHVKNVLLGETFAQLPAFLIPIIDIIWIDNLCGFLPLVCARFLKFKSLFGYLGHTISQLTIQVFVRALVPHDRRDSLTPTFQLALVIRSLRVAGCVSAFLLLWGGSRHLRWILWVVYKRSWFIGLTTASFLGCWWWLYLMILLITIG